MPLCMSVQRLRRHLRRQSRASSTPQCPRFGRSTHDWVGDDLTAAAQHAGIRMRRIHRLAGIWGQCERYKAWLQECTFVDNSAVESFGGAVHADGCSLLLRQSLFLRNRGVSSGSVGGGMASAPPAHMVLRKSPGGLPRV